MNFSFWNIIIVVIIIVVIIIVNSSRPIQTSMPNLSIQTSMPNLSIQTRTPTLPLPIQTSTQNLPIQTRTPEIIDCKVSDWSSWSICSENCGGGIQERTRNITTQPSGRGITCPVLKETRTCNTEPCSYISSTNKVRNKDECKILLDNHNLANFYTSDCSTSFNSNNLKACQTMACGSGINYDNWYAARMHMLGCDYLYNDVTQLRDENKLKEDCKLVTKQNLEITEGKDDIKDCVKDYCSILRNPTNCTYGMNNFTKHKAEKNCSKRCFCSNLEWYDNALENTEENRAIGLRNANSACVTNYTRNDCNLMTKQNLPIQTSTPNLPIQTSTQNLPIQTSTPNLPIQTSTPEIIDCKVSDWSSWSTCSENCGGGIQERTRNITTQPSGRGITCPVLKETRTCNTEPCSYISSTNKVRNKDECKILLDNHNLANFYTSDCSTSFNSNNLKACQTMACGSGINYDNWYAARMHMLGCDYLYNDVTQLRDENKLKEDCKLVTKQNLEITEGKDDIKDCVKDYCSILRNPTNCTYGMNNFTKHKAEKNCSKRCFCSNLEWYNGSSENTEENRAIGLRNSNSACVTNYTSDDCKNL